jgi:hypothetical protein
MCFNGRRKKKLGKRRRRRNKRGSLALETAGEESVERSGRPERFARVGFDWAATGKLRFRPLLPRDARVSIRRVVSGLSSHGRLLGFRPVCVVFFLSFSLFSSPVPKKKKVM